MSNEGQEWTVVSSKSRQKKVVTLPSGGNDSRLLKNQERNTQIVRRYLSSDQKQNHDDRTTSKQSGAYRPLSVKQRFKPNTDKPKAQPDLNPDRNTGVPANQKQEKTLLASINVNANDGKKSEFGVNRDKLQKVVTDEPTTSSKIYSQQNVITKIKNTTKSTEDIQNKTPGTSTGVLTTAKKKKRFTRDERRKKREEKFYQALYQNKDSHIQFVSADTIRKLQNDNSKASSTKTCTTPNRNFQSCDTTQSSILVESFSSLNLGDGPEDFPSLMGSEPQRGLKQPDKEHHTSTVNSTIDVQAKECSSGISQLFDLTPSKNKLASPALNVSKSPSTPTLTPKGKKSKQPMIIDVNSLIVKKKVHTPTRKFATPSSYGKSGNIKKENFKITPGNPLDSSGPGVINRGKIREKKKKPTKLKLTILKSRALRKILLEERDKQTMREIGNSDVKAETTNATDNTVSPDEVEQDIHEGIPVIKSEPIDDKNTQEANSTEESIKSEIIDTFDDKRLCNEALANHMSSDETIPDIKVEPEPKEEVQFEDENYGEVTLSETDAAEIKGEEIAKEEPTDNDDPDVSNKLISLLDEVAALNVKDETPIEIQAAAKTAIHTRKFRDYCDMYTSKQLHRHVMNLLFELYRFQDRLYHTDPIKFKTKRRIVSGLKEAFSYLNLNKVQLLIIAPDIEKNPEPGGLDERIIQILAVANAKGVPYVFSGTKYNLGKPMKIKTPVSIISVLDKQNCEETFRALLEEASQLREKYRNDVITKVKELMNRTH